MAARSSDPAVEQWIPIRKLNYLVGISMTLMEYGAKV